MKRNALVVGVDKYDDAAIRPLRFAVDDAILVADRLAYNGFRTRLLANPTRGQFEKTLDETVADLSAGDLFLLFFSGQGFTDGNGSHRLFCRDDGFKPLAQIHAGLPVQTFLAMDRNPGVRRIALLDSAHSDGHLGGSLSVHSLDTISLSNCAPDFPEKMFPTFIIRASDRFLPTVEVEGLRHGLFAKAIANALEEGDKSIRASMKAFHGALAQRLALLAASNAVQITPVPVISGVGDDFPLVGATNSPAPKPQPSPPKPDATATKPPPTPPKPDDSATKPPPLPPKQEQVPAGEKPGEQRRFHIADSVDMDFRWCPATTSAAWKELSGGKDHFLMGSPMGEIGRNPADEFQHPVRISNGFWIAETPVLQAQWEAVMGRDANHSPTKGGENPVTGVAWDDARDFLSKINNSGCPAQLPTEAQWEYACRAGTTGPFGVADKGRRGYFARNDLMAWCAFPFIGWLVGAIWLFRMKGRTRPVRQCSPNAWGLCDMHGNCGEWCADWFGPYPATEVADPKGPAGGDRHVVRGMNARRTESRCRSASRWQAAAKQPFLIWLRKRHRLIGLRLVINPKEGA